VQLMGLLEKMKMEHLGLQLDAICEQASKKDLGYREFLTQALQTEWSGRHQRGVQCRLQMARFPWVKSIEQFDFAFQPSIDRKVIRELSASGFVDRAENVIILGPPGVGKTHLAIGLGLKALEVGHKVLFLTLESMITRLVRARTENRVERQIQQFIYPKVLIIDEMGYLPMSRDEAGLFFRLLTRRYEKASTIITSNKSFVDWGEIFNDQVLATAILDRLLHHCTTLNIKGESYRLKEKRKAGLLGSTPKPQEVSTEENDER
jgi:DNA replication protein DnaC